MQIGTAVAYVLINVNVIQQEEPQSGSSNLYVIL